MAGNLSWRMAWRNLWRNPRRTGTILAAVVIGVWSMVFLGALMRGMADSMVNNQIATLTGHLKIFAPAYHRDPVIQNCMPEPQAALGALAKDLPPGALWAPRIRVGAIANNARHSAGVTLVGIDPPREARVSFIGQAVRQGKYLAPDDELGILVGQALLDEFETKLGHKLVLMSQSAKGEVASRAFRIQGVYRAEMEAVEKSFVFVTLPAARKMLGLPQALSELSVMLPSGAAAPALAKRLAGELDSKRFKVASWQELLPAITAYLQVFDSSMSIWYLVVFVAMGFGMVNTTLMAVFERMREFGLLRALGVTPFKIAKWVLAESWCLLLLGVAAGDLLAILSLAALGPEGLEFSSFSQGVQFAGMSRVVHPQLLLSDIIQCNLVVIALGMLVNAWPALKAARITPVQALAHT